MSNKLTFYEYSFKSKFNTLPNLCFLYGTTDIILKCIWSCYVCKNNIYLNVRILFNVSFILKHFYLESKSTYTCALILNVY